MIKMYKKAYLWGVVSCASLLVSIVSCGQDEELVVDPEALNLYRQSQFKIAGSDEIVYGEEYKYSTVQYENGSYKWTLPQGTEIVKEDNQEITVIFTPPSTPEDTVIKVEMTVDDLKLTAELPFSGEANEFAVSYDKSEQYVKRDDSIYVYMLVPYKDSFLSKTPRIRVASPGGAQVDPNGWVEANKITVNDTAIGKILGHLSIPNKGKNKDTYSADDTTMAKQYQSLGKAYYAGFKISNFDGPLTLEIDSAKLLDKYGDKSAMQRVSEKNAFIVDNTNPNIVLKEQKVYVDDAEWKKGDSVYISNIGVAVKFSSGFTEEITADPKGIVELISGSTKDTVKFDADGSSKTTTFTAKLSKFVAGGVTFNFQTNFEDFAGNSFDGSSLFSSIQLFIDTVTPQLDTNMKFTEVFTSSGGYQIDLNKVMVMEAVVGDATNDMLTNFASLDHTVYTLVYKDGFEPSKNKKPSYDDFSEDNANAYFYEKFSSTKTTNTKAYDSQVHVFMYVSDLSGQRSDIIKLK